MIPLCLAVVTHRYLDPVFARRQEWGLAVFLLYEHRKVGQSRDDKRAAPASLSPSCLSTPLFSLSLCVLALLTGRRARSLVGGRSSAPSACTCRATPCSRSWRSARPRTAWLVLTHCRPHSSYKRSTAAAPLLLQGSFAGELYRRWEKEAQVLIAFLRRQGPCQHDFYGVCEGWLEPGALRWALWVVRRYAVAVRKVGAAREQAVPSHFCRYLRMAIAPSPRL